MEIKLFLGKVNIPAIGEWIYLPMTEDKLTKTLDAIKTKYGTTIVSDYVLSKELTNLHISEYEDITLLNWIIQQPVEFVALYIHSCCDLDFARKFYFNKKYLFIPNVSATSELGEAVVKMGLLGDVNKHLIDMGYINYDRIGEDFECNGITIYYGLGAVGQLSDSDFKKWRKLITLRQP